MEVSLTKGVATIELQPGNRIGLDQIRKAVESKGLNPKDATVKAVGRLTSNGEHFTIQIEETKESFEIASIQTSPQKSKEALKTLATQRIHFVALIPSMDRKTQPGIIVKDFWK